jgi:AcrR family transcriptional regulator
MASPLERRERDKQELRTNILDAARELFIAHGYEAVTMRKIAEKIEYSPTAIYLHFTDKEALIQELCLHDFRAFGAHFLAATTTKDPIERLRQSGAVYFDFAKKHPQHYRLMFMTPLPAHPARQPIDPAEDAYALLLGTVEQAMAEGRLRPELKDAALVAQTIWAASHGVVSLQIAKGDETGWITWRPLEDRVRMMIDVIIDAFTVPETGLGGPTGASRPSRTAAPRKKSRR